MFRDTYLAGDILYKGSALLRELETKKLESRGIPVYSPKDDKSINDKTNQTIESNNGLAEKIVYNDTIAIKKATHCVINPERFAEGTLVELGQIKAYNEMGDSIREIIESSDNYEECVDRIHHYVTKVVPKKKVYVHLEDIRRTNIPEIGDRRSHYCNQYVYGVILELTENRGCQDFDEIVDCLEKDYKEAIHEK